jgi:hypothetical protein
MDVSILCIIASEAIVCIHSNGECIVHCALCSDSAGTCLAAECSNVGDRFACSSVRQVRLTLDSYLVYI